MNLNFAIKQQIWQTLRRTDIYVVKSHNEEGTFYSSSVKNYHDETLLTYERDTVQGKHKITFMGGVVAEMNLHVNMEVTQQHEDILNVGKAIDNKANELKKISEAMHNMSKEESLIYQRAFRELQNARYE